MIPVGGNIVFSELKLLKSLLLTCVFVSFLGCDISVEKPPEKLGKVSGGTGKNPVTEPPNHPQKAGSIDQLLDGLIQRLEAQPDDLEGWLLLAKSYQYLGQAEQAKMALSKAQSLGYEGSDIGSSASSNADVIRDSQIQAEKSARFFHEPIYQAMEDLVSDPVKAH